jgi:low temperature requirement protein LtrA
MSIWGKADLLRVRDGHEARVSFVELFFDLIYVFAVTQLSHRLLDDLSLLGALQTLLLWFAVWLGWQYTCWVTNWFDPETLRLRLVLFAIMLLGLLMSAAIPRAFEAFGVRGLIFGACYAAIQVGRTLFVVLHLGPRHALAPNFRRMLGWLCIAAIFWVGGGLAPGNLRLALWAVAVACEYLAPMIGFRLPGMGRSRTSDWTIEGGHLAERCQLFVIVALGESILETGVAISGVGRWDTPVLCAALVAFIGSLAMWWLYFDTSSHAGRDAIVDSTDPGRVGAHFHYVHVVIVAGVIVCAVANELVVGSPAARIDVRHVTVLVAGPALYLLGNAVYKKVVYGRFPLSHLAGLGTLAILTPLVFATDLLMTAGLTTVLLVVVAAWESRSRRSSKSPLGVA